MGQVETGAVAGVHDQACSPELLDHPARHLVQVVGGNRAPGRLAAVPGDEAQQGRVDCLSRVDGHQRLVDLVGVLGDRAGDPAGAVVFGDADVVVVGGILV